jgi:hypothetical protein
VPSVRGTLALVLGFGLSACEHSQPFDVRDPESLGPAGTELPVRLTFNVGTDESPAVTSEFLVYSTRDPARVDGDRCLAYLPPEGGTLLRTSCPGGTLPDDWQDALLQPAPGSGARMAFVWEQAAIGARAPGRRHLRVAPTDDIDNPQLDLNILFQLPDGERVIALRQLQWASNGVLRFVAGEDYLDSNDGLDTVFVPKALATVDPETGVFASVPGTDSAYVHGEAPDGSVWFLRTTDPRELLRLDLADGAVTVVGTFGAAVQTLGVVDGQPVAFTSRLLANGAVENLVEWLDPATGSLAGSFPQPRYVHGIAGVPGRRQMVLELTAGQSRDLWLFTLP